MFQKVSPSVIPSSIERDRNAVLHIWWDNFDLNEETPSRVGTTHTHGIVMQEVIHDVSREITTEDDPTQHVQEHKSGNYTNTMGKAYNPQAKMRSVECKPVEIQPCFVIKHLEPIISYS